MGTLLFSEEVDETIFSGKCDTGVFSSELCTDKSVAFLKFVGLRGCCRTVAVSEVRGLVAGRSAVRVDNDDTRRAFQFLFQGQERQRLSLEALPLGQAGEAPGALPGSGRGGLVLDVARAWP